MPRTILTDEDVAEIRRRLDRGEFGIDLAIEFGVSPALISKIKRKKRRVKHD